VNSREIYFIPCLNPDGYVYTRDQGIDWRKNRRPFPEYGTVGVDLNRNYGGSSDGNPEGEWGTTIGQITHDPGDALYCGPMPFSEAETTAERDFILTRDFCAGLTYHTYSELVLHSWSYVFDTPPNGTYISNLAIGVASLITQEDYTGTYDPGSGASLYPTSGDATDWVYGYHHYAAGADFPFFTVEIGQSYQPPTLRLAQIVRENFDGAFYLLQEAGDIRTDLTPRVIRPDVADLGTNSTGNYTVEWAETNPAANPDKWEIRELSNPSVITDDVEGSTNRWDYDGFTVSTARAHSGNSSFKSSEQDERADHLTSEYPYYVEQGDSLIFWTWYDIEEGWDYGYVEVSLDKRVFDILELYTGSSGGWVRKAYSLEDYEGESVSFRFRYTTDSYVLEEGYYVDDIYPATLFNTITTLSSTVTDTFYNISGQPTGTYYYDVRGHNSEWNWCDRSTLSKIIVTSDQVGTLAGAIADSVSGAPLSGVLIEVLNGMIVVTSGMSSGGAYSIPNISPGTYDVRASAGFYETKLITDVTIIAQQIVTENFELAANWGYIAGLVTDSVTSEPISGVLVEVIDSLATEGSDVTTVDGLYLVDSLIAGFYYIEASGPEHEMRIIPNLSVEARGTTYVDFRMMPLDLCGDVDDSGEVDIDDDSGEVDIDDAVFLISYIFAGGPEPDPYWTGDVNCSTGIDIDDAVYLVAFIFSGGPPPCEGC